MPEVSKTKYMVQAGWKDVPHLTADAQAELLESIEPHLRVARTEGAPALGAGAVYPINLEEIIIRPFPIPESWPRAFGMDIGWNRTAAIWGAINPDDDVLYLYTEHYRAHAEPSTHATAIKARGDWIPGFIDPASKGASQRDGKMLIMEYQTLGLDLSLAEKSAVTAIHAVWLRLASGRIRVFESCRNWQAEYRLYHRNEKGEIVKAMDHLMDATRYLVVSGLSHAIVQPVTTFVGSADTSSLLTGAGY
tara:strand:- start:3893 stop:4639 length:747 start_codon:yes stop_codon:yes gene_type:complete